MPGIKISALPAATQAQLTDVFPADQMPGPDTRKVELSQVLDLFKINGSALSATPDTNITITLGGSFGTALLNDASITLGWTGVLSPARGGSGVNNGANTLTLGGSLTTVGAFASTFNMTAATNVTFPTSGTLATTAQIPSVVPSALTKTDDTNVTLTLGGNPALALLQATSLTLGWIGQLSPSRGGTGVNNGSSTLNLGGSLTTVGAFSSTFNMTGVTNVTFPTSGTLATTATASGIVNSGLINQVAWYAANGTTISGLTTANNGVLVTSGAGVPSISNTLPNGLAMGIPASLTLTNALGLPIGGITATGTPSATTFLRGDSSWVVPSGIIVQQQTTTLTTGASTTTILPADDTIPQITEGSEFFNVSITPKSASNILLVEVFIPVCSAGGGSIPFCGAIFRDSNANAVAAFFSGLSPSNFYVPYYVTAGSTATTTFRFRYGPGVAGTAWCNTGSTTHLFSTASIAFIKITELQA